MQYNLQLLKAMLEEVKYKHIHRATSYISDPQVSSVDGHVDQATYSRVIRLWVKDVRDRCHQQATPSLEVSQLSSDSEVSID